MTSIPTESTKVLDQPCPCSMCSPQMKRNRERSGLPQTGRKAKEASKRPLITHLAANGHFCHSRRKMEYR
jgi:hypothetical protein